MQKSGETPYVAEATKGTARRLVIACDGKIFPILILLKITLILRKAPGWYLHLQTTTARGC